MAKAGFFFFPKEVDDDTSYCYQCGCCLGGWEPSDDPLYDNISHVFRFEHSKRYPYCPYLVTGRIAEPAAFQRIFACSTEKYIKVIDLGLMHVGNACSSKVNSEDCQEQ